MRRRDLIKLVSGSAIAWPLTARAQSSRNRRIGVIVPAASGDTEYQTWVAAFLQALAQTDWTIGRNIRVDIRWATSDSANIRKQAAELAAIEPDVIVAGGTSTAGPILQATHSVPVVFATVVDPVGAGFVDSLARPGGNATGFLLYEYSLSGKWLDLLKQIAPGVTRVAVLRDPTTPSGSGQFAAIQSVAPSLGVEISPINMRDADGIESAIAAFARTPNDGMILTGSGPSIYFHDLIIKLAARYKLPAVYYERFYSVAGGLLSYGADRIDLYRRAAGYVDRILKGEKPADLPVQAPTKYELIINLKTARTLGLNVPQALLGRADEVIE
jgi:putative tryptophan/tyrosine transport system substrate-binding protein